MVDRGGDSGGGGESCLKVSLVLLVMDEATGKKQILRKGSVKWDLLKRPDGIDFVDICLLL